MKTDIEIAQETPLRPIKEIADSLGIEEEKSLPYGNFKAKISLRLLERLAEKPDGRLVVVTDFCKSQGVPSAKTLVFEQGSEGALELAKKVVENGTDPTPPHFTYPLDAPVTEKIEAVAKTVYGANRVIYTPQAEADLDRIETLGYTQLPVCIAKTQRSLSDNAKLYGAPKDFKISIQNIKIMAGAGYLVPIAGDIMLMPGLSKEPQALKIDLDETGRIKGLA